MMSGVQYRGLSPVPYTSKMTCISSGSSRCGGRRCAGKAIARVGDANVHPVVGRAKHDQSLFRPAEITPLPQPFRLSAEVMESVHYKAVPGEVAHLTSDFIKVFDAVVDDAANTVPLEEYCGSARVLIDEEIQRSEAVLLRGIPVTTVEEGSRFLQSLGYPLIPYVRIQHNGERESIAGVEAPSFVPEESVIGLHNEVSYSACPPAKIIFLCMESALQGGESILAKNIDITNNMDPQVLDECKDGWSLPPRPLLSRERLGEGEKSHTWQRASGFDDMESAEKHFKQILAGNVSVRWNDDDSVTLGPTAIDTFRWDSRYNQLIWYNQMHNVYVLGNDYVPLDPDTKMKIAEAVWNSARAVKLEKGDLLVMDNFRIMHGRLPYKNGPDRKRCLLVSIIPDTPLFALANEKRPNW